MERSLPNFQATVDRWLNSGCDVATPGDALIMRRARGCALVAYGMQFFGGIVLASLAGRTYIALFCIGAMIATTFCLRRVTANAGEDARLAFHSLIGVTFGAIIVASLTGDNPPAISALYPIPLIMAASFVLGTRAAAGWTLATLALLALSVAHTVPPPRASADPGTWRAVAFFSRAMIVSMVFAIGAVSRRFEDGQTQQLEVLARQDGLTGLMNRNEFDEQLSLVLSRARRHEWSIALLFIDLDRFKEINDNFGHAAGDAVLKAVSGQIEAVTRKTDVAGRIGGDEFAVLLESPSEEKSAEVYAQRLLQRIEGCAVHTHPQLHITASIGIAFFPEGALDAGELMRRADLAMYEAKRAGGGRVERSSGRAA